MSNSPDSRHHLAGIVWPGAERPDEASAFIRGGGPFRLASNYPDQVAKNIEGIQTMSMTLQLRRAPDEILGQLPTKDDAAFEFLCPENNSDPAYENGLIVDIDKAWHAIHYLLTKSSEETNLPAGFLVGGTPIGDDFGYGPARILKNKDVREVAAFLESLPEDFVQTELRFSELQAADIYPTIWDREDDEDIKYVSRYFADLRKFISDAAVEDHGIILALL